MHDLKDIHISQQDAVQIFQQMQYLMHCCDNAETLSPAEVEIIIKSFGNLVQFIPNYTSEIHNPTYCLERLTINKEICGSNKRLSSLAQLQYRPREIAAQTDYNRVDFPLKLTPLFRTKLTP